jgi:hypothetical protein
MILYYEVKNINYLHSNEYFRYSLTHLNMKWKESALGPSQLVYRSNRIWRYYPDTDQVVYAKNRDHGLMFPVDKREFLVVQLTAEDIKSGEYN